jgi:hypothetical protein
VGIAPARRRCYVERTRPETTAAAPEPAGEIVLVLEGHSLPGFGTQPEQLEAELQQRFPQHRGTVLFTSWRGGEVSLVPPQELAVVPQPAPGGPAFMRGGISGRESALRAVLRAAVDRGAVAVALVGAAAHDESADWLGKLLVPIVERGCEYVCPAYVRPRNEGTLNTGVVYPLTRALYGWRLRQPLGGEVALSASLARTLLDDTDWRRDPDAAGSDAWMVAKVLCRDRRLCQAWLGAPPADMAGPADARDALSRVLAAVFREMERHAGRWQRVEGSQPVELCGDAEPGLPESPHVRTEPLVDAFLLGYRELSSLWSLVLPPATLLGLRHAARAGADAFRIPDELWARTVYDFAVAHFAKLMERNQLLGSMTPLYLGWVASFMNETRELDARAAEQRVEALCGAFEREKSYLIARWRWPDGFNP